MSAFPGMTIDTSVPTDWNKGLLRNSPIGDAIIGSPFAAVDDNEFHTAANPHSGQDFPCPWGIPIRPKRAGVIRASGYDAASGWWVSVLFPEGWSSFFCHMAWPCALNSGTEVGAEDVIGYTGNSGAYTTGEHLHWTLNKPTGIPVDPMLYVGAGGLDFSEPVVPPPQPSYPIPAVEWVDSPAWASETPGAWHDYRHSYQFRARTVMPGALIELKRDGRDAGGWELFHLEIEDYEPGT